MARGEALGHSSTRMRWLPASLTYSPPPGPTASPRGELKAAAAVEPSAKALAPLPAQVVTLVVVRSTVLSLWALLSATSSCAGAPGAGEKSASCQGRLKDAASP